MPTPLAHVVAPPGTPLWAEWLAALALFGGALGAVVWWRDRPRRNACAAAGGAGLVATAALLVTQPSLPLRPAYGIALHDAPAATTPVLLQVCPAALDGAGTTASPLPALPGPGRLLLISVDGRQVAEVRSSPVVVAMGEGRHHVVAELLTADHRAFAPPVIAAATVVVTGSGPLDTATTLCPER